MLELFKLFCQISLVLSMVGLTVANLIDWSFKPFILGVLYAIANTVIFIL